MLSTYSNLLIGSFLALFSTVVFSAESHKSMTVVCKHSLLASSTNRSSVEARYKLLAQSPRFSDEVIRMEANWTYIYDILSNSGSKEIDFAKAILELRDSTVQPFWEDQKKDIYSKAKLREGVRENRFHFEFKESEPRSISEIPDYKVVLLTTNLENMSRAQNFIIERLKTIFEEQISLAKESSAGNPSEVLLPTKIVLLHGVSRAVVISRLDQAEKFYDSTFSQIPRMIANDLQLDIKTGTNFESLSRLAEILIARRVHDSESRIDHIDFEFLSGRSSGNLQAFAAKFITEFANYPSVLLKFTYSAAEPGTAFNGETAWDYNRRIMERLLTHPYFRYELVPGE